jgi:hypothetical protein
LSLGPRGRSGFDSRRGLGRTVLGRVTSAGN